MAEARFNSTPTISDRVQRSAPPSAPGTPVLQGPSVEALEDALYEMLAIGVDPTPRAGSFELVQAFLHEHARARKSHAELLSFFAEHQLPVAPDRSRAIPSPIALPLFDEPAAVSGNELEAAYGVPSYPALAPKPTSWLPVWGAAACALLLLGGVAGVGYVALREMQSELSRVQTHAAAQAKEIERVQAEAATLRTAMRENNELVKKVDQKSELLVQSLLSPLDPALRE